LPNPTQFGPFKINLKEPITKVKETPIKGKNNLPKRTVNNVPNLRII